MYSEQQRKIMIDVARQSIANGLEAGEKLALDLEDFDDELKIHRASFVTLKKEQNLRGCIGCLEAYEPLLLNVARNAFSAAFRDTRFEPLRADEFDYLDLHIAVLGDAEAMVFESEEDLLSQLKRGVDGVILRCDNHSATFLPSVWEQLPEPKDFIGQLKLKAGLPKNFWDGAMAVQRYGVEDFGSTR